jgi:uncharacterized protein YjiS (DUF1127 family)
MSGKIFSTTNSASCKKTSWKIAARLVATSVLAFAKATLTAIANRSSVNALAEMDDRMLRDIGLTRSDVDSALAQPWHKDPSRVLTVRRIENRVRRLPAPVAVEKQEGEQGRKVVIRAREACD